METGNETNRTQAALWNGRAGRGWVEAQTALDRMYAAFDDLFADMVSGAVRNVLDIGCGTGSTTMAMARKLNGAGRCLGVDISQPMIAAARARADREGLPVDFQCADAQCHAFAPGSFDLVASRFGVSFFADPVHAFANFRRAARTGAALRFAGWRAPSENPFMTTAERAAAHLLPDLPVRDPDAPGQFAFADAGRIRSILERAGWAGIDIRPVDIACVFPQAELDRYLTWMGPVGRVLQDADAGTHARVLEALRAAFVPYIQGDEVRFTAACWMVGARAW